MIQKKYNFKNVYIMVQDVAHARKAGAFVGKLLKKSGWNVLGEQIYPTGTTDFSMGLLKAKKKSRCSIYMDGYA
jgi:branched-chain amino acid transport system substrate-binding protein